MLRFILDARRSGKRRDGKQSPSDPENKYHVRYPYDQNTAVSTRRNSQQRNPAKQRTRSAQGKALVNGTPCTTLARKYKPRGTRSLRKRGWDLVPPAPKASRAL